MTGPPSVNQRRSEKMRAYWGHVKDVAVRKHADVKDVRHSFVGRLSPPTRDQNHYTGRRYHYVFKRVRRQSYATVATDEPITEEEAKRQMAEFYNNNRYKEHYDDEDEEYGEGDFTYQQNLSTVDETVTLEGEESTHDLRFEE